MLFLIYTHDTIPGSFRGAFFCCLCVSCSRSLAAAPFPSHSHSLVTHRAPQRAGGQGGTPGVAAAVSGHFWGWRFGKVWATPSGTGWDCWGVLGSMIPAALTQVIPQLHDSATLGNKTEGVQTLGRGLFSLSEPRGQS